MQIPDHDLALPHDFGQRITDARSCPPGCPYRLRIEQLEADAAALRTVRADLVASENARQAMSVVVAAARNVVFNWSPPTDLPTWMTITGNALADSVARLDGIAKAPLSHTEARTAPTEGGCEGETGSRESGAVYVTVNIHPHRAVIDLHELNTRADGDA